MSRGAQDDADLFASLEIWLAQDFTPTPADDQKTPSQDFGNGIPTLLKSSYHLPEAEPDTADEQQRSHADRDKAPGPMPNTGLSAEPPPGLQV